jgi:hypothetical protein
VPAGSLTHGSRHELEAQAERDDARRRSRGLCVGYDEGCFASSEGPNFCCNANGDPCCPVDYCGVPMTPACQAEKACQDAGGNYSNSECVSAGDYADANLLGYDDATMLGYDGPSSGGSTCGSRSPHEVRLRALGLDGSRAWAERYRQRPDA